jgi:ankyrin repeat protein
VLGDVPHYKTGATALHVAAAKGYIKVINLLIQAGAQVNTQVSFCCTYKILGLSCLFGSFKTLVKKYYFILLPLPVGL